MTLGGHEVPGCGSTGGRPPADAPRGAALLPGSVRSETRREWSTISRLQQSRVVW